MVKNSQVLAVLSVSLCVILFLSEFARAAPYDYDTNFREMLEALIQKDADQNQQPAADLHRLVRKNNRSPSLRLRFGRRSDPALSYQIGRSPYDHNNLNYNLEPATGLNEI
uniref:Short neuropeptide F n=1 Tax=Cacopsylla melanoneura TaxID=428564 RepID=A0A8D8S3L5_9HEMI